MFGVTPITSVAAVIMVLAGVLGTDCLNVTYTSEHICALKNSSVDLSCSYKFPEGHKVTKSFWFVAQNGSKPPVDLREYEGVHGRIQYLQYSQNDCSLRITNVKESDAHTYKFRVHTGDTRYTGYPGVTLSVTELEVAVSDTNGGGKELSCSTTSCTLGSEMSFIWYKNGQLVSTMYINTLRVSNSTYTVSYSCAVKGLEKLRSPAVYSPRNASAFIISSRGTVEGDFVTLICTSDANPPVLKYSWFKKRTEADTQLGTGQNYSINSISSQHSGFYYCTAENLLGQINSSTVWLDVLYSPQHTSAKIVPSGDRVEGDSVTLTCSSDANPPVLSYTWFMRREAADTLLGTGQNYSINNISSQHSGLYYCTAHNQLGDNNSTTVHLDVLYNTAVKYVACGLSVVLVPILIVIFLSLRRRKTFTSSSSHNTSTEMSLNERGNKDNAALLYDNMSVPPNISHSTKAADSVDEDEVCYASIQFTRSPAQEVHLHPHVQPAKAQSKQEDVEYAAITFPRSRAKTRTDENAIYSRVQHI